MNDSAHQSAFAVVYFIVWAALAISTSILYQVRRDAAFRIRWHARISLIVGITILVFMWLISPSWFSLVIIGVPGGLIMYLILTKTTICKSCGRTVQGVRLIQRAEFCPHCGGETVCSKIFNA
jgi:hypothetical protein